MKSVFGKILPSYNVFYLPDFSGSVSILPIYYYTFRHRDNQHIAPQVFS